VTNAQWLETLLPLSRNSEDTDTVVNINHEALENIRKFLLATGADPLAVLRGEARVATAPEHVLRICKALLRESEAHGQAAIGASYEYHARVQTDLADAATLLGHLAQPSAPPALTELREAELLAECGSQEEALIEIREELAAVEEERSELRADLAQAKVRIAELEATYQQAFGCHHSWVEEATRSRKLQDELRELAQRWEEKLTGMRDAKIAAIQAEYSDATLNTMESALETLDGCASELTAALDAMGAKK
jgi:chromosome segregation ATPase